MKKSFTNAPTPTADTEAAAPLFISGITRRRKEARSKRMQILIKPSTYDKLNRAADAAETSMNDLINAFIEDGLDNISERGDK